MKKLARAAVLSLLLGMGGAAQLFGAAPAGAAPLPAPVSVECSPYMGGQYCVATFPDGSKQGFFIKGVKP